MFEIQTGKIMVYINFQEVVKNSETLCTMWTDHSALFFSFQHFKQT